MTLNISGGLGWAGGDVRSWFFFFFFFAGSRLEME